MPDVSLTLGTVEYLPVRVTDALARLGSLDSADLRFDIIRADEAETIIDTNVSGDNQGMLALCLVDTRGWEEGDYDLYIYFEALPEAPRLGPFRFKVED